MTPEARRVIARLAEAADRIERLGLDDDPVVRRAIARADADLETLRLRRERRGRLS